MTINFFRNDVEPVIGNTVDAFEHAGIQCIVYEELEEVESNHSWYGGKFGRLVVTTGCGCADDARSIVEMFFDDPLNYLENVRHDYDEGGDPPKELVEAIADARQRIEEALAAYKKTSDRYTALTKSQVVSFGSLELSAHFRMDGQAWAKVGDREARSVQDPQRLRLSIDKHVSVSPIK